MDASFEDDFDADAVSKALEEVENGTETNGGDSHKMDSAGFPSKSADRTNEDLFKINESENASSENKDVENDEEKKSVDADSSRAKKAEPDNDFADFVGYEKPSETKKAPAVDLDSDLDEDEKKASKSDDEDDAPKEKEKTKKPDLFLSNDDDDDEDEAPKSPKETKRKSEAALIEVKDDEDDADDENDELAAQEREEDEEIAAEEAYFKSLSEEEKEWHQENGPRPESLVGKPVTCTACFKQVKHFPRKW